MASSRKYRLRNSATPMMDLQQGRSGGVGLGANPLF